MDKAPIRRVIRGSFIKGPEFPKPGPFKIHPRIESLLSTPSWSIKSMLPKPGKEVKQDPVTKEQLHHLLKLSALPPPPSIRKSKGMRVTLDSQIYFVKQIQKVDTTGVEPLVAIRDETAEHVREQTVTLETLQPFLEQEEKVGNNGTIRRRKPTEMIKDSGWNPFETGDGSESRRKGKFFFVRKTKEEEKAPTKPVP